MKTLVIGYGNDSRRDDGVGVFVVGQLARLNLPGIDLQSAHQLEVELAETLAAYDVVIFVDAATTEALEPIHFSAIRPRFQSHAVTHYLAPSDVLSLCKSLYRREPQAFLFSVRGHDFGFGTDLSPETARAARDAVRQIAELITRKAWPADQEPVGAEQEESQA